MMRQASMQAYNDAWLLLLVCFICVVPAVFLLRKPRGHQPAALRKRIRAMLNVEC